MLTTDPQKLAELYERIEVAKENLGERYLLHPNNHISRRETPYDLAGNSYLPDDNMEFSSSLLISVEDI
jgi:hypothetical protein